MAERVIWTIHVSDIIEWATKYTGPLFHAALLDPPYGLEFMGKEWDKLGAGIEVDRDSAGGFLRDGKSGSNPYAAARIRYGEQVNKVQEWHRRWAAAIRDVCFPGAPMMSFGGTRTHHRLTCGIEDAGWEIRDCMMWLYGSGFPKSHDISKAIDKAAGAEREQTGKLLPGHSEGRHRTFGTNGIGIYGEAKESVAYETIPSTPLAQLWDGYGTALKPAWEPIILAMNPLDGTFAHNAQEHGVAGLWVDGGRIAHDGTGTWGAVNRNDTRSVYGSFADEAGLPCSTRNPQGRWPANLILSHHAECGDDCHPDCPVRMLDEQSGELCSNSGNLGTYPGKTVNTYGQYAQRSDQGRTDSGGASRFFYCAKASSTERNAGLDDIEPAQRDLSRHVDQPSMNNGEGNPYNRGCKPVRNDHPTVKPIALAKYLATLLLPPPCSAPWRILIPFSGSGSEAIGAMLAGWEEIVLIDLDPHYCDIANYRLKFWQPWAGTGLDPSDILSAQAPTRRREKAEAEAGVKQVSMFDLLDEDPGSLPSFEEWHAKTKDHGGTQEEYDRLKELEDS